jgi:sulfatase maturation enzyme AslB (radical SAM superfamily)
LGYERFLIFDKAEWLDRFIKDVPFPPIQIDFQMSSLCNLNCRWCVGRYVSKENNMKHIRNTLSEATIRKIIDEIKSLGDEEISVSTVLFSGFTGEPLVSRDMTLLAMKELHEANISIGLYTNGILMGSDTWESLLEIESVHVSLDGGPKSWAKIKQPLSQKRDDQYKKVIDNLDGISRLKKELNSKTELNVGYTVTVDNCDEIDVVVDTLRNMNLNSICLKHDITGSDFHGSKADSEEMLDLILQCQKKYDDPLGFRVFVMHESEPTDNISSWSCKNGCYYRHFFCSIGSNGKVYPCDYQTLSGVPEFGDLSEIGLKDALDQKSKNWDEYVTNNKAFRNVCPPFADKINKFLNELVLLKKEYSSDLVMEAINNIRKKYK